MELFENRHEPLDILLPLYQINNESGAKKNRRESELSPLSGFVPITEEISKHLIEDLESISQLSSKKVGR